MSAIPRTPRPTTGGESDTSTVRRQSIDTELVPAHAAGVVVEGVTSSSALSPPLAAAAATTNVITPLQSSQSRQSHVPVRSASSVRVSVSLAPTFVSAGFTIRVVPAEGEAAPGPARSAAPRATRSCCTAAHLLSAPAPCMLLRRDSFWTLHEGAPQQPPEDNYVESARLLDLALHTTPALFEPPPSPRS